MIGNRAGLTNIDVETSSDVAAAIAAHAALSQSIVSTITVPLYDNTLAAPGTWDVQNISQDYDDLALYIDGRGDRAETVDYPFFFLNGDTTVTHYRFMLLGCRLAGTFYTSSGDTLESAIIPAQTALATSRGYVWATIPKYTNAYYKIINVTSVCRIAAADMRQVWGVSEFESANAINRITIVNEVISNFVTGSRLVICGVRYRTVLVPNP